MEGLLYLVLGVFAALQIILFFKIWNMTDNVSKLTEHFCPNAQQLDNVQQLDNKKAIAVVSSTGDLVEINFCKNGVYQCYNPKSMLTETYNKDELIFK
ncbi:hypothetical protein [Prevotella melaninogenica]|jgi:hypothetical protein|uniref:hypothetical protein n=1 Tax=Prevotella melaninogenica TaxID=28132 RepID=UPI00241E020B|nr:hypothetical protein [Prevotella melaninogenica]